MLTHLGVGIFSGAIGHRWESDILVKHVFCLPWGRVYYRWIPRQTKHQLYEGRFASNTQYCMTTNNIDDLYHQPFTNKRPLVAPCDRFRTKAWTCSTNRVRWMTSCRRSGRNFPKPARHRRLGMAEEADARRTTYTGPTQCICNVFWCGKPKGRSAMWMVYPCLC